MHDENSQENGPFIDEQFDSSNVIEQRVDGDEV